MSIRKQTWTLAPRIIQYLNYQWLLSAFPTLSPILNFSSSWVSLPLASHSFIILTFQLCAIWVPSLFLSSSLGPLLVSFAHTCSVFLSCSPPTSPLRVHPVCTAFSFCSELLQMPLAVPPLCTSGAQALSSYTCCPGASAA